MKNGRDTIKQTITLFGGNFIVLFLGMGLFPLLPVYATRFGADNTDIGVFFAVTHLANAMGPIAAGLLGHRFGFRRLFILSAALAIPAIALLGSIQSMWQLTALVSLVWFFGGFNIALVNILTGHLTTPQNRGKIFGLIALSIPFGTLLGGAGIGYIAETTGYQGLFLALAGWWGLLPLIGLAIREPAVSKITTSGQSQAAAGTGKVFNQGFVVVLAGTVLSAAAINAGRLSTSLVMMEAGYSAGQISSATAVSGLVAIPAMLLFGFVSDRFGRAHSLAVAYLFCASGALMLFLAVSLWQFWIAAALIMIAFCANVSMSSALVTDQLNPQTLSRGLAILSTSNSAGGIISFIGAGMIIDRLGTSGLSFLIALLPFMATALLEVNQNPVILKTVSARVRRTSPPQSVPCIPDPARASEAC